MPAGKILLIEDDPSLSTALERRLNFEGYDVTLCTDGESGLKAYAEACYDLILLDLMLPGVGGIEISRFIRKDSGLPILMLTALSSLSSRVAGFESGADDYLVKPFEIAELLVRIRALLRRTLKNQESSEILKLEDLSLDLATREVRRDGDLLELTPKEFSILEYMLRNPKRVLTREQIYSEVWNSNYIGNANIIDVNIKTLRAKLEANKRSRMVKTSRGVGYCLRAD